MREFLLGETTLNGQTEKPFTCEYRILVRTLPPPVSCESYGICVYVKQTGEREEILDITVSPDRIEELADLVFRNGVTPCTLCEIVADWL